MTTQQKIKAFILAWGIPLLIVSVALFATPNPRRPITDFPAIELTPDSITVQRKLTTEGTEYFVLCIQHADGRHFCLDDPEREPIEELKSRIPEGVSLRLVYYPTWEENVLLEIAACQPPQTKFLAFDAVMSQYLHRMLVVYAVAAIWFVGGTALIAWKLRQPV